MPLCQLLIDKLGLTGAYRVLGFIILVNCILSLPYVPNIDDEAHYQSQEALDIPKNNNHEECPAEDSNKCRNLIDCSVWKVPVFTVAAVCGSGIAIVTYTGQFHLVSAYHKHISVNSVHI